MHAPRVLITAGPTHEPIDSVRYLANRSSGRMGVALAEASAGRGWPTTLLLGPTPINPPQTSQIHTLRFQTTADLQALLREHWPAHDVLIMAAAVADYRPVRAKDQRSEIRGQRSEIRGQKSEVSGHGSEEKIARSDSPLTLELEPTPDLLAEAARLARPDQILIGFALEPSARLEESAKKKLIAKGLHAIVANPLETMDSPTISAAVYLRDGRVLDPGGQRTKQEFAQWLLQQVAELVAT